MSCSCYRDNTLTVYERKKKESVKLTFKLALRRGGNFDLEIPDCK